MVTTIREIIEDIHPTKVKVGTIPYIEIGDIDIFTKKILFKQKPTVAGAKLCPEDSVIISRVRPSRGAVGLVEKEIPVSSAFTVLKTKKEKCHPKYLFYYLAWNNNFFSFLQSRATGATYPTVKEEDILNYPVEYLPNLVEQKRIVAMLEEAESLKKKRAEADLKMSELIPSFLNLFVRENYESYSLGSLIIDGPQNGLYKHLDFYTHDNSGVEIIRIDRFYDGYINEYPVRRLRCTGEELKKYKLNKYDILINRVNSMEYLGKCALVRNLSKDTVFESNMMRFSVDKNRINPEYLIFYLMSKSILEQIKSKAKKAVNQASINQRDVKSLMIKLPPIALQNRFAHKVKEIEAQKEKQKQSAIQLSSLFSSLLAKNYGAEWVV